jgi:hypothetical protein
VITQLESSISSLTDSDVWEDKLQRSLLGTARGHLFDSLRECDATLFESLERSCQHRKQIRLRAQARELGFDLVKLNAQAAS